MKVSNNNFSENYFLVNNKSEHKNTFLEESNNKIVNNEPLTIIDLDGNTINNNTLCYLENESLYKKREIRENVYFEPDFKKDDIINLIKRLKKNITNLISIKETDEYLKLKNETYLLQIRIRNDKNLLSALKTTNEVYQNLKKDIHNHEITFKIYHKFLLLAEQSMNINHIYQLGFSVDKLSISDIIEKITEIEQNIFTLNELNKEETKESFNIQKKTLENKLDSFLLLIKVSYDEIKLHYSDYTNMDINKKLSNITHTPIGFSLHNILQEIIDYELEHIDNSDKKNILKSLFKINELTDKFNIKYRISNNTNLSQDIINSYALQKINAIYDTDKHVFGELSIEDIINTEIVYSYQQPHKDDIQYSTFTIFEYLNRYIEEFNFPLTKRKNINIKFPIEFQPGLINYLNEEAIKIKKQIDMQKSISLLKEKKDNLQEKMPSLEKYLKIYLGKIGKEHNVSYINLDDLVEFRYKADSANSELNAAINHYYPPIQKLYTVRDILLGRERKWLSENLNYKLDEVLGALYPSQYTKQIINKINSADIQNSYIAEMEKIKENGEIKKQFYEFLEHVLTTYGKKDVLYYLTENSPGLLVFPDKDRGPVTGIDKTINSIDPENTPVAVISIFTGECLHYPSFRDFKRAITENKNLKTWVKTHFTNYHEFNPTELKLVRENLDYSFLFEDIISFNIKKADVSVRSPNEAFIFELFSRFKDTTPYYSLFSFFMGNLSGIVYGSVLSATPSFLQASISDTEAEYKSHLKEGVMSIAAEVVSTALSNAFQYTATKAVNLYIKYKFNNKLLQFDKDVVIKLAKDFHHNFDNLSIGITPVENENRFLLEIKPAFNPNNLTANIPADNYLTELQLTSSVAKMLNHPIEEYNTSMIPVANFMLEHGMTDIKYRGMYIWNNPMDNTPITHFAVIGKKENKNYVFDLTAHRFKKTSNSGLDGPLILEESVWKNRYQLAFPDCVIKYKDYVGEQMTGRAFNSQTKQFATKYIEGVEMLAPPTWYLDELNKKSNLKPSTSYSIDNNPVYDTSHVIAFDNRLYENNKDYIADLLYQSGLLNKEQKALLVNKLSLREKRQNTVEWMSILDNYRQIKTMNELLLTKPGEIVFFDTLEGQPAYMMVSLGNGLFSGYENNKLCHYVGDSNSIILAEQIGHFIGDKLERYDPTLGKLKIYAGQIKDSEAPKNLVYAVVEKLLKKEVLQPPEFITTILKDSHELSSEQATIFFDELKTLLTNNNDRKSVKSLLANIEQVDNYTQLSLLPPGHLVFFFESDYKLKGIMVSLGNGSFAISDAARIDISTKHFNDIVEASQFGKIINGKFNNTNVISGIVNLEKIRQESLLGKDSIFNLYENRLFIKAQGKPSIINYMNGVDFSNLIEGLAIKILGFNAWQKVDVIELQSCFASFGSLSFGEVIANKLNKKVIVHPFSAEKGFVINNYPSAPKAKVYEAGVYLSDEDLKYSIKQSDNNIFFLQQLSFLFENINKLLDREKYIDYSLYSDNLSLVIDLAKLVLKKINLDDFLDLHPEYYGFNGELGKDLISKMDILLKTAEITNKDAFAEVMIGLISLTKNSYILLNMFMGDTMSDLRLLSKYLTEETSK